MSLMDIFVDLQYGNFKIGSFNHLLNIKNIKYWDGTKSHHLSPLLLPNMVKIFDYRSTV